MSIRKFIIISTVITIIGAFWIPVVTFFCPPVYEETFLGEYKHKVDRLREVSGKRIVIIGGSGMAFDVKSSIIDREFLDYEVVNMGMYAPLGTVLPMENAKPLLHKGDIVILAPEEHKTPMSLSINPEYAWQAMDGRAKLFLDLDMESIGKLLAAMPRHAIKKAEYLINKSVAKPDGIYARASFDSYGDVKADGREHNTMPMGFDPTVTLDFDGLLDKAYIEYVNRWSASVKRRGVEVYFMMCPYNSLAEEGDVSKEEYFDMLRAALDIRVIGDPGDFAFDPGWFYDTNFHLNSSGQIAFTEVFVKALKAELGITKSTDIKIPQMPPMGHTDEDAVIYSYTYSGDSKLKSVTIPEDVSRIEDFSFYGCSALKEIVIESDHPSKIIVGEHLLDGTDADIIVPKKSLSAYRTNYRFSRYADRIKGR